MADKRGLGFGVALVLVAPVAWAEGGRLDPKTCTAAAAYGQQLRGDGRLRAALDAYKTCSEAECADAVRTECAKAYQAVQAATPSVIVVVRGVADRDSTDVAVLVDGQLTAQAESTGLLVDPGMHTFRIEGFDGVPAEQRIFVHEGEKNRTLLFTRTTTSAPVSTTTSSTPLQAPRHSVWPWLVIGTGAAGVVVGAVMTAAGVALWSANDAPDALGFPTNQAAAQIGAVVNHTGIGLLIGGAVVTGIGVAWHFLEAIGPAKTMALSPLLGPGLGGGSVSVTF